MGIVHRLKSLILATRGTNMSETFKDVQLELDIMLKYGESFKLYRGDGTSIIVQINDIVFCCNPAEKFFSIGLPDDQYRGQTFLSKADPEKPKYMQ